VSINQSIKESIKSLRSSQPFNRLTTSGVRSVLALSGIKSEFLIKHLHRIDLVESKLPNGRTLRLQSKGDDWVSNQVFWRGWEGYEPETVPFFFHLAQKSKVTFDIGAYVGFFSLLAAHANPDGKVYTFEPMPAIYKRLEQNIALNQLSNVETVLGAVGEEEGEAKFFHQNITELPTSSSLSFDFMKDNENIVSTDVKVYQLDAFAAEKNVSEVDLMKIDTESTEPEVLRGGKSLLENNHPHIFCEVLKGRESEKPLEEILRPLGYNFYLITPEGLLEKQNIEGHEEYLNYFFSTLDLAAASNLYNRNA
jgi:FkbM family methyltransferase